MAERKTTKINLQNDLTVTNANGVQRFHKGTGVEVPEDMAEDLLRMDYEHTQYLGTLHTKRKFEVDAGTIAAGGGAE